MLPWIWKVGLHCQPLLFQFGTLRTVFATSATLTTGTRPATPHSGAALSTRAAALTAHAWAALSTRATHAAHAAHAGRTLRTILVRREFAVTVLVEFLQRLTGFGDFVSVNNAIVVQVERFNDRIHRTLPTHAARPPRTAAFVAGATRAAWPAAFVSGAA